MDPGEKHVGVAIWNEYALVAAMETTPTIVLSQIVKYEPSLIVIEAFSLRSTRWTNAQAVQAVATLKLIGAIEYAVDCYNGLVVEQQPSVRHTAQQSPFWRDLQKVRPVPANSHARSAVAHGLYYQRFAKR